MLFQKWGFELKPFGTVHIIGIITALLSVILAIVIAKKYKDRESDRVYGIAGLLLIMLEVFKVFFNFKVYGSFSLERIPFQICTLELFFLWAVPFVKNKFIKDMMISFCLIGLYGASFYYVNPTSLFNSEYVIIAVQAIVWHDIVIFIGIFTLIKYQVYRFSSIRFVLRGWLLWIIASLAAVLLNCLFIDTDINFFYLSSNQTSIPYIGLNWIFKRPEPYLLFILGYIIYFSLGLFIVFGLIILIGEWLSKRQQKGSLDKV